jgi:sulfatase modifying factor 1
MRVFVRATALILVLLGVLLALVGPACINVDDVTTACADDPTQCDGIDSALEDLGVDTAVRPDTAKSDVAVEADAGATDSNDSATSSDGDAIADTKEACVPITACASGDECGTNLDGCGGTIPCGTCTGGKTCNTATHKCETVCTPITTCPSTACGTIDNGCGGTLSCPGCPTGKTCDATSHTCVCVPSTTACTGKECGLVDNGCGTMISCGSCVGPKACGGGGVANKCGGCSGTVTGPSMVNAGGFCIDSTEVTQAQYKLFLAAKGTDYSGQPAICPGLGYLPSGPGCSFTPTTTPDLPMTCVNWCQAYSYCKWAGKRLCGKIGGGPVAYADYRNKATDQWYYACSINGAVSFPYGGVPDNTACVWNMPSSTTPAVVKSKATCVGAFAPFDQIYDMSGNVAEWTDSCGIVSGETYCRLRGGNYTNTAIYDTACDADFGFPFTAEAGTVGIRCCAD